MDESVLAQLRKPEFQQLQLMIDMDLAEQTRGRGCLEPGCDGKLHVSNFERKPRGSVLITGYNIRFSFCCEKRECRKRATADSVRFLGPKVYIASLVVLVTALRHGVTPVRMKTLKELLGVSRQTVLRWREWWTQTLPKETDFWEARAGQLRDKVQFQLAPLCLLELFRGAIEEKLLLLLRLLGPLKGTRERVAVL